MWRLWTFEPIAYSLRILCTKSMFFLVIYSLMINVSQLKNYIEMIFVFKNNDIYHPLDLLKFKRCQIEMSSVRTSPLSRTKWRISPVFYLVSLIISYDFRWVFVVLVYYLFFFMHAWCFLEYHICELFYKSTSHFKQILLSPAE